MYVEDSLVDGKWLGKSLRCHFFWDLVHFSVSVPLFRDEWVDG